MRFIEFSSFIISVDGNWGSWTEYSQCSATCGGGVQERTRVCVGTAHGGLACLLSGSDLRGNEESGSRACNVQACPGKV